MNTMLHGVCQSPRLLQQRWAIFASYEIRLTKQKVGSSCGSQQWGCVP